MDWMTKGKLCAWLLECT